MFLVFVQIFSAAERRTMMMTGLTVLKMNLRLGAYLELNSKRVLRFSLNLISQVPILHCHLIRLLREILSLYLETLYQIVRKLVMQA